MHTLFKKGRFAVLAAAALTAAVAGAQLRAATGVNAYNVLPLVSDGSVSAPLVDAKGVNIWGLTASATSPWWVSNNGSNTSTLYSGVGAKIALTVTVDGGPTGAAFNASGSTLILPGVTTGARFLFSSEDGKLRGWNSGAAAVVTADRSSTGAVYKGLAIATLPDGSVRLYAPDFHNGRVDVFDGSWQLVTLANAFVDKQIPKGFAPFNVQTIGTRLFVTYAKQDAAKHDDVAGPRLGYVDAFDFNGKLLARVAKKGPLNSPWGLALAPADWGKFGGDLLVGNFGDGHINVYQERSNGKWAYLGSLRNGAAQPIQIPGLWALAFGNGASAGPTTTLYFSSGPNDEKGGLFGSISPA